MKEERVNVPFSCEKWLSPVCKNARETFWRRGVGDLLRAVLVDDEKLLLTHLGKLVSEMEEIELIGMYNNPREARDAILRDKPDVVFLDIEMPEMNGIQLAEQIQGELPFVHIVFVTAYSEYAVKAFELNAVDYLLKPLNRDRLAMTFRRMKNGHHAVAPARTVMIHCFQALQFSDGGSRILDVRWRTNKAKELFLFLLQYRHIPVRKDIILDQFWPDTGWEKSYTLMYTTIYQIRKALEAVPVSIKLISREDSYLLELNGVKLDVDEWENELRGHAAINRESAREVRRLLDLYRGDYLADLPYAWAEGERERLRNLWLNQTKALADYYVRSGEVHEAIALVQRIQDLHPYREDSYFMLMKMYGEISDRLSIETQYQKLQRMLADQFGELPDREVQTWYENWKNDQN